MVSPGGLDVPAAEHSGKCRHDKTPPRRRWDHGGGSGLGLGLPRFNYIIDVAAKWHGSSLFFISTYGCPGPTAISPTFEAKFARMEFAGGRQFSLSFMRHTGKWVVLYDRLSLDECLGAIKDDPWFQS